ncbi:unnamed protein product [marine sediment metagenome]|uniref:DUF6788 domain-containing protein n=1 Tax=marine sediment metagenome TaxID=412755 RepID=X1SME6_9ZZZZ
MKQGIEEKITRVYQHYEIRKTGRKRLICGPYWFGYWQENGKQRRVYIGKEMPAGLKYLIDGRFKKPGYKNYAWPGRAR